MTDPEAVRLLDVAFAWIELREHITASVPRVSGNVLRATIDVEMRLMELISEGERSTVSRGDPSHAPVHDSPTTTAIRRALRLLPSR